MAEELSVTLKWDDASFQSGIEGSMTKAAAFGSFMGNIASTAVVGGLNLLGHGLQNVGNFLASTVSEAGASQEAIAQLEAVLKSTGGAAGVTSQQAQDLASSLQRVTKFSDDAIIGGENMLLTFTNIGSNVFPRATATMLDMSQALGQDLKASAIQLGKALNDPIKGVTALQRVGVTFTDEQKKMIETMVEAGDVMGAQTIILDELEREFGGSAEAAGKTFTGSLEILKNKLSDVKETLGNSTIPMFTALTNTVSGVFDSPQFKAGVEYAAEKLTEMGDWVINTGIPSFMNLSKTVQEAFEKDGLAGAADTFIGGLLQGMADKINEWVSGGGAEELSNKLITWVENIGTGSEVNSKALTAAGNLVKAIATAVKEVDWEKLGITIELKIAEQIEAIDAQGIGASINAKLKEIFQSAVSNEKTSEWDLGDWALNILLPSIAALVRFSESEMGQAISSAIKGFLQGLFTGEEATDSANTLGQNIPKAIGDGIDKNKEQVSTAITSTVSNSLKKPEFTSDAKRLGEEIPKNMVSGFNGQKGQFINALNVLQSDIENKLTVIAKMFYNRVEGWVNQAKIAFTSKKAALLEIISDFVSDVNEILKKIKTHITITVTTKYVDSGSGGGGNNTQNLINQGVPPSVAQQITGTNTPSPDSASPSNSGLYKPDVFASASGSSQSQGNQYAEVKVINLDELVRLIVPELVKGLNNV